MTGRKKAAPRRQRVGKVHAGQNARTLTALRRALTRRMPANPAPLRRAMLLRDRLLSLRPDVSPSARREALRRRLDALMPAEPGRVRKRTPRR